MRLAVFFSLLVAAAARPSESQGLIKRYQTIFNDGTSGGGGGRVDHPLVNPGLGLGLGRRLLDPLPDQSIQDLLDKLKDLNMMSRDVTIYSLDTVTGAVKDVTGLLSGLAREVKLLNKRDVTGLTDIQKVLEVYKQVATLLKRDVEVQDFGLEDVTGAIKGVTGYLADISKTIGPALSAISLGKRDTLSVEYQNTDWNKVLDDLKGVGKDIADIFANVGPAVASVVGKRDVEIQDFGLEDVTGAIKGVTGYLADISKTIGPALSAISLGKRDTLPVEYQNTDWNKVLDDLKGVGKDIADIFANVGPTVAAVVGKRDVVEIRDFGLEDVTGAIKGVTGYLADISKTIGPALSAISIGKRDTISPELVGKLMDIFVPAFSTLIEKRDSLPVEYQNTDWNKVLDDLKGVGKDIADIFANVGPTVAAVVGKRDVDEIQDFGLEDVTGAIKGVTGYLADISKTIGPALSAISLGKRDTLPVEYQNTDWNKVLDDLKGVGKDIANIFANVGPAVASVVGKRDVAEIQDFGLEDVTGAIKGVTGYLADISKTIGPALSAISIGKRDDLDFDELDLEDLALEAPEETDWNKVLDDLKGIGKDLGGILVSVAPAAIITAVG